MLLPRQFHVSVVENSSDAEVGRARWLFPLYLVAINLFVIPVALAGLIIFPFGAVDSDMYVLALPMAANSPALSVAVFIGRPVGCDGHGDRGMRRAVDHGIQRYRCAAGIKTQPAIRQPERFRYFSRQDPSLRDLRDCGAGLSLLPRAGQCSTRRDRPALVRGDRTGLRRRFLVA